MTEKALRPRRSFIFTPPFKYEMFKKALLTNVDIKIFYKKKKKINRNEVNKFIYLIINIIKRLRKKFI